MRVIVVCLVLSMLIILPCPLFALEPVAMRIVADSTARLAPDETAPTCAELHRDTIVQVGFATASWYGFTSEETKGKTCWLPLKDVEQVKTRSAVLAVPLLIEAGRAVVTFLRDLFTDDRFEKKADLSIKPGDMVSILLEKADRVKIRTDTGQIAWIARKALTKIMEFTTMPKADLSVWSGHLPVSAKGNLLLEVRVQKADGSPVANGETLKLGDEYEIHARCSKDCFLRITCETPVAGAVCQYSPNRFGGFSVSARVAAGQDAWPYLLPPGVRFRVSEPVMSEDILRIEAISAEYGKPFYYVAGTDKGEGCADAGAGAVMIGGVSTDCATSDSGFSRQGCGYRGGGFSATQQGQTNPVPEVVSRFVIKTVH